MLAIHANIAYEHGSNMILEAKDAANFSVKASNEGNDLKITISGLAFHSALVVKDIEAKEISKSEMRILVFLMPTNLGYSGKFEYTFKIGPEINTILFGGDKKIVWQRDLKNELPG